MLCSSEYTQRLNSANITMTSVETLTCSEEQHNNYKKDLRWHN